VPGESLRGLWQRVEALLRLALEAGGIDASSREAAEELLDHNELGLAWSVIVEALVAEGATPSRATWSALHEAAVEMDLLGDSTLPGVEDFKWLASPPNESSSP
jgi:hypothetical protein